MAVVRPELTPSEMDWIVAQVMKASKKELHDNRRAVRELKRAQTQGWEIYHREMAHLRKMRAALPTAPREDLDEPT